MERKVLDLSAPQARREAAVHGPRIPAQSLALGPSVFLDIVRLLAALTVTVGHLSEETFTTGWSPALLNYAEGAVAVFFVLSGFMIRYITSVKYGDLRRYAADRIARIYSVALPAVALTILFDLTAARINPTLYAARFGDNITRPPTLVPAQGLFSQTWISQIWISQIWIRGLFRIVISLSMLSQSWFHDSSLFSNSPLWSLSYECVYYALFGIALYLRGGKRIVACIVVFLLIGPTVFLMFPLWLLGCAAYDAYQDGALEKKSLAKLFLLSLLSIACIHGSRALIEHFHARWFYIGRLVPWMDTVAIAAVILLLPACIALRNLEISEDNLAVRIIRKLAAATFPLYLIHFPLFVLLAAVVPYPHASLRAKLALLATALTLGILLAGLCDNLKNYLRNRLLPANSPAVRGKQPSKNLFATSSDHPTSIGEFDGR